MKSTVLRTIAKTLSLSVFAIALLFSCQNPLTVDSATTSARAATYTDYRAPSQDPPAGLTPAQCPQFVIFGYDDNQYADGMNAVLDLYTGLKNPAGAGQAATFDGTNVSASFYIVPANIDQAAVDSWKRAYNEGHEIGNHTWSHQQGGTSRDVAGWYQQINDCQEWIVNNMGIPANKVNGFRTPYLEYNAATFEAMKQVGLEYDVSFEGGWRYWPNEDGSTLYWPYTMDDGKPAGSEGRDFGQVAGIWEIPDDCIFYEGGRVTGLDYNMWFSKGTTKQEFVDMLKYSFDKKYYGNRSPMNYGLHSNYYSVEYENWLMTYESGSYAKLKANVTERTEALAEFMAYALTKPATRIVSAQQALEWIKNPVPLDDSQLTKYQINASAGANGSISPAGTTTAAEGSSVTYTITADAGFAIDTLLIDGASVNPVYEYTFSTLAANHTIAVTFKPGEACSYPEFVLGTVYSAGDIVHHAGHDYKAKWWTNNETPPGSTGVWEDLGICGTVVVTNYDITATAGANGTISPSGTQTVAEGTEVTYTITPDTGYEIEDVVLNGVSQGAVSTITFTVTANSTLTASFKAPGPVYFTLTTSAGPNGSISPLGAQEVLAGTDVAITITPDAGYEIDELLINGVAQTKTPSITLPIVEDTSIHVTFRLIQQTTYYTVSATAGSGGSITPPGNTELEEGGSGTWTITPDQGYKISDVTVNGASVGAVSSYTVSAITANITIDATFELISTTTPAWSADSVAYALGDEVIYNGITYVCKYAHTSNAAWVPGTPGLWIWEAK